MSFWQTVTAPDYWRLLQPKIVTTLTEGYGAARFRRDAIAGVTVAVVAIPLSMAIAIGSGTTPDRGLITAIVGGFLVSALGGSRYQVGGPAAAFIVIVDGIIRQHGMGGLLTAMVLAGILLVAAGLLKLGTYIKYVPGPVILGFTSGIGLIILIGQLRDLSGIESATPADVPGRIVALWQASGGIVPSSLALGIASLAGIFALRAFAPRVPALLVVVVAASALAYAMGLPAATIGSRFGGISASLPAPALPDLTWSAIVTMLPSAFTVAFLVGVESLLSAVAADTMAGSRHRSNVEVLAQGAANIGSALFGGVPATGVIARTGTNIEAGATSPVAGIVHALAILAAVLVAAPLASYMVLPALAAVLISVAWRLLDLKELWLFATRAPWDDRIVLLATLALTVLVDLEVAIAVGVGLASILFIHRMAETPGIETGDGRMVVEDVAEGEQPITVLDPKDIPEGVAVFRLHGPLFFGRVGHLADTFRGLPKWPRAIVLRMREVPLIDATGATTLEELARDCRKHDCRLILSGLAHQPRTALHRYGFLRRHKVGLARNITQALKMAEKT